jgi:2'-5' RNA ligase
MARIGVAIAVPEPFGDELQRQRKAFGDPNADAIPTHITLLSPTSVHDADLPDLECHLEKVAAGQAPFVVRLSGTGSFRPLSPVVFVAMAEGISDCETLADAVRSGPLAGELAFPYHPHVTVAHDLPERQLQAAAETLADYACSFEVGSFALYVHGSDGVWRQRREFGFTHGG